MTARSYRCIHRIAVDTGCRRRRRRLASSSSRLSMSLTCHRGLANDSSATNQNQNQHQAEPQRRHFGTSISRPRRIHLPILDDANKLESHRRYKSSGAVQAPIDAAHYHHPHPHNQYEWEGSQVVADLAAQIRESVRSYTQQSRNIKLVGITTSGAKQGLADEDAEAYSEHIANNFLEDGFSYDLWRVPADPQKVEDAIFRAEEILGVHGVLVFYPIFKKVPNIHKLSSFLDHTRMNVESHIGSLAPGQSTQMFSSAMDPTDWIGKRGPYQNKATGVYYKTFDDYFRDMIPASLDVEGLCNSYNSRIMSKFSHLYVNRSDATGGDGNEDEFVIFPCTALAVARILDSCHWAYDAEAPTGQRLKGCVITIVNRSEIFGRPLAAMLANDGATVYSVDIESILIFSEGGRTQRCKEYEISLEDCVRQSSVVVSAVPNDKFHIPVEWLQENSTVVNVAREKNIDEDDLRNTETPGILYIPQVGQVTVALLEHNLVQLHRRYHSSS
mmetsp:Transcript_3558/g.10115  ORF Transcript_3558/g.10115 Transcript_3558/m.10115 type:complete len:501 (-) Transcript_3558:1143-2645(-)